MAFHRSVVHSPDRLLLFGYFEVHRSYKVAHKLIRDSCEVGLTNLQFGGALSRLLLLSLFSVKILCIAVTINVKRFASGGFGTSIGSGSFPFSLFNMTRGNQRERDRERAQARGTKSGKTGPKEDLTPEQRRERDAKALQEKQAKKAAQAAGGGDSKKSSSTKK
ncbi:hypothetical protein O6H91_Y438900 [Diphasiastrum complanatum]|nr:hypothetical protein O6H91_Y438900 [Diphasiastrum complanatum]